MVVARVAHNNTSPFPYGISNGFMQVLAAHVVFETIVVFRSILASEAAGRLWIGHSAAGGPGISPCFDDAENYRGRKLFCDFDCGFNLAE